MDRMWRLVHWYLLHFHYDRQHHLNYEKKAQDIADIKGKKIMSTGTQNDFFVNQSNHFFLQRGWMREAGINNSRGVSGMYNTNHTQHSVPVPNISWERFGVVHIEQGSNRYGRVFGSIPTQAGGITACSTHEESRALFCTYT